MLLLISQGLGKWVGVGVGGGCSHNWCPGVPLLAWFYFFPAWMRNYIHYKVWDEIAYPFLNFNGATVKFRNR